MARLPLPIVITPLSELELTNALQLRLYRRQVDSRELNLAHGAYRSDLRTNTVAKTDAERSVSGGGPIVPEMDGEVRSSDS